MSGIWLLCAVFLAWLALCAGALALPYRRRLAAPSFLPAALALATIKVLALLPEGYLVADPHGDGTELTFAGLAAGAAAVLAAIALGAFAARRANARRGWGKLSWAETGAAAAMTGLGLVGGVIFLLR